MPYTAIHDRPPFFGNLPKPAARYPPTPRYATPDLDPLLPLARTMSDSDSSADYEQAGRNGHDRSGSGSDAVLAGQPRPAQQASYQPHPRERETSSSSARKRPRGDDDHPNSQNPPPHQRNGMPYIYGSFFGMTARNPITRTIGDFLLEACQGRNDVEVEVKLGQISTAVEPGQRPKRLNLPSMAELILPNDFRVGPFRSDMSKKQHTALNQLLNEATAHSDPSRFRPDPSNPSARPPHRIKFFRAKQVDSFYNSPGNSKTRVSRDMVTGEVVACIKKRKVADLNVANKAEVLDYRVSVSTEEPCEMPEGTPIMIREKDRACYRHQLVQIDLTFVRQITNGHPVESFEVEIEVIDVPALIAEGLKEKRGEPNQYDEMVTSILDSARILIRNIDDRES